MNALRRIHRALVPGGLLLDLHPVLTTSVEAGGSELGELDESEFAEALRATEAGLEEAVAGRLFAHEQELRFDFREHFDTAAELLEAVAEWEDTQVPPELEPAIRAASPPLATRTPLVLRRLRRL